MCRALVSEHNAGVLEGYTHSRRPVVLRCVETTGSAWEAISRERQIKGWSRRKKERGADRWEL